MLPAMLYFEDLKVGRSFTAGPRSVSEAEIIAYARRYDPQPFHTDPAAGREAGFGGVIASGWQTCAIAMRLICEAFVLDTASLGASSVPAGTWHLPVRPGDALSLAAEVLEARRSASRPDRGIIRCGYVLHNATGEKVFAMEAVHFIRCRDSGAARQGS